MNKTRFTPNRIIVPALLSFCLFFYCCSLKTRNEAPRLKKETLISKLELVNGEGRLFSFNNFISIYYLKDIKLYAIPTYRDSSKFHVDKDIDVGNLLKTDTIFTYFLFKEKDRTGIKYNSLNEPKGTVFFVDSLLQASGFKGTKFYDAGNDSLVRKEKIKDILFETSISKIKRDPSYPDSNYYYFTKKSVKPTYSFSKFLDSTRKKETLFKVRMVYNPTYDTKFKINVPRREFYFEIKQDTVQNPEQILNLFKRYEMDRRQ